MKTLLAGLILTLAALGPAEQLIAQSPGLPNEGSRLEYDGANRIWRLKWWGKSGRTYFIQHTDDLNRSWQWLPFVEAGNGSVREWGFNPSGDKFFIRLKYSDIPTDNPSLADFDGDRVSNLDEVTQGTNPLLAPDTDSNGLPDDWETFYFGAIGQNPNADPDGDGLTNLQEWQAAKGLNPMLYSSGRNGIPDGWWIFYGLSPYSSSTQDTDGDGRTDVQEFFDATGPLVFDSAPTFDNGHNELSWTNNSMAVGVIIERKAGLVWQTVGIVSGSATTFTDATSLHDIVYVYRVKAYN
jgi:hypothetical protein